MPQNWIGGASDLVNWAADLLQIGSVIFVLLSYWRARTRLREYLQALQGSVSARPCALAVSFGGDIAGQVENYLKDKHLDFPPVRSYAHGYFTAEEFLPILKGLQQIKDELTRVGVTEVHLFYKGPVTMAMALGALTDNWVPVKVYEFREGTFHHVVTLEKGLVKGLLPGDALAEGESLLEQA